MKHNFILSSLIILLTITMQSCIHSNAFEKNTSIPSAKWNADFKPSYEFEITDTTATYSMFLMMRHTDAYPFSNLWLNVKTKMPNDSLATSKRLEITLAQANGKWIGRGMNEIWEHKIALSKNSAPIHFSQKGIYHIELNQIMRSNPLPEVISVGVRLEKN